MSDYETTINTMLNELRAENERLRAELAATRERAICYRTEYPYCDADIDMHAKAMVAAERERCARIAEGDSWHSIVDTVPNAIAAAIRKGEP